VMRIQNRVFILLFCVPILSGCGTFVARTGWRAESPYLTRVYPATSWDYHLAVRLGLLDRYQSERSGIERAGMFCLGIADLPISLLTDTVCLPMDIICGQNP
jgi:uncharacterized protein YceK